MSIILNDPFWQTHRHHFGDQYVQCPVCAAPSHGCSTQEGNEEMRKFLEQFPEIPA